MMQIFSSNAGGAEAKVEFVRIDEDPAAVRLQTAITRYEKDGVTVDLIGSIHIADKGYFVDLDRRFVSYEALLFEMVGGEKYGRKQPANGTPTSQAGPVAGVPKPEKAPNEAGKSSLREMYKCLPPPSDSPANRKRSTTTNRISSMPTSPMRNS